MLSLTQRSRSIRFVVAATACVVWLGATASGAQASNPAAVRPRIPLKTLDDALVRYAGAYTEQEIRDGFAFHDVDGNGIVCGKPFQKDRYYPLQNLRDDLTGRALSPA